MARHKRMEVLITNTVVLNGGDAAILLAIERHVRAVFGPDVELVVADTQPELARRYYPDLQIIPPLYLHAFPPKKDGPLGRLRGVLRFARWYTSLPRLYLAAYLLGLGRRTAARVLTTRAEWSTLCKYAAADVIVSTGGTYLVENYWLAPRIFDFRIALLLGRPLVLYTQSLGPFAKGRVRSALRGIFRNAALILLRDEASLKHVYDLCEPNEVHVCLAADAVFSLADPSSLAEAASRRNAKNHGLRVAVSVRRWPFFRRVSAEAGMEGYKAAVADLVDHLVRQHDAEVVFLSTCQGVEGYAYNDAETAGEVAAALHPDVRSQVEVDAAFHTPGEILERLGGFDFVVATRMHAAILALAAGTPVLPIAYEFKTQALFSRLGMSAVVHDIEDVTGEELIRSADRMLADLSGIRERLFPRVEAERRRAAAAADCLEVVYETRIEEAPVDG